MSQQMPVCFNLAGVFQSWGLGQIARTESCVTTDAGVFQSCWCVSVLGPWSNSTNGVLCHNRCWCVSILLVCFYLAGMFQALAKMEPGFRPMLDGVLSNRARWERLDAERLSKHAILETGV